MEIKEMNTASVVVAAAGLVATFAGLALASFPLAFGGVVVGSIGGLLPEMRSSSTK